MKLDGTKAKKSAKFATAGAKTPRCRVSLVVAGEKLRGFRPLCDTGGIWSYGYNIQWGYNIILYIYNICIYYVYIMYIIYMYIIYIYIWIYGGSCGENGDNFMEYSGWWFRSSTCFKCVCLPSDDHPSQLTKASPRVVQAPPDGISDFLEEIYSDYRDDVFTLLELINSSSLVLPSMLGLQKQPVAALNTLEISFQPSPQHWHFHTYHT